MDTTRGVKKVQDCQQLSSRAHFRACPLFFWQTVKINQLRYICEVERRQLNVSAAAEALHTSQPGVSKQIRLLEDELGIEIFERSGKQLIRITPAGHDILAMARQVLDTVGSIRSIAADHADNQRGSLAIATTQTQALHALPDVVQHFRLGYPHVQLHIHQGTPLQIAEQAASGVVDFAIATEALELFSDLVVLPCYQWNRCVVVPTGHPLCEAPLSLEAIAEYPLVTYVFGFTGRSRLDDAFASAGLDPQVSLTATDAEVIKTYVRLGLGVGIIASMAVNQDRDRDLVTLDASHLFKPSTTSVAFRSSLRLRGYACDFITTFAPHLTRDVLYDAADLSGTPDWDAFNQALQHLLPGAPR